MYCILFFPHNFDVISSIAKSVQHDRRLPFWKPASVFCLCLYCKLLAFGEINILLLLTSPKCPFRASVVRARAAILEHVRASNLSVMNNRASPLLLAVLIPTTVLVLTDNVTYFQFQFPFFVWFDGMVEIK